MKKKRGSPLPSIWQNINRNQLGRLSPPDRERIVKKLVELQNPHFFQQIEKLQGVEGCRIRAGDYRVLFTIDQARKEILVFRVKHRSQVYRF